MNALVLGGTGLVGSELLRQLRTDASFDVVYAPGRTELASPLPPDIKPDVVFCCVGTTIKVAGSQEAFRHVDHHLPVRMAQEMLGRGAQHYIVISAMGADVSSRVFYNRVKGEMEADLRALGYPMLTIVHPSLLLGDRKEPRLGEQIASFFMTRLKSLIPRKWRAVTSSAVARAMITAAKSPVKGVRVIENEVMIND